MTQTKYQFPYLHSRWDDQVALEREMLAIGESRMRDKINKARAKQDMTRLRPHRSLLKEWVLPVGDAVRGWIERTTKRGGVRPICFPLIRDMDPDVLSVVTIKTILRRTGLESRFIVSLAMEIGTWVEHEARASVWEKEAPDDWAALEYHYKNRGSNAAHQRRSRVSIFNRHVGSKIGWEDWSDGERMNVGLNLVDIAVTATQRFRVVGDPNWMPNKKKASKRPLVLEPDPELLQWLSDKLEDELVYHPSYMPTLIPPKPWSGPRDGGYWTPFVNTPFLIRFKAHSEDVRQRAIDEFDAIDMPEVYRALNTIQDVPWRINTKVLDVARHAWDQDLAIAGLQRKEAQPVPPRPDGALEDKEVYKEWVTNAARIQTANAKRFSRFIGQRRTFEAAERFRNVDAFYFPHMLDFRGRMYPIPADLSPQGDDLHRGLLTFAEPKPVGPEDAGWLSIHLANVMGVDKVSYNDRMAWVEEREEMWRHIAADPLGNREWVQEDGDSWQSLAAVFEWVRYLDEGDGMLSSLPIRVDGTCNGIQHLAAMVRDEEAGRLVNLTPSEKPQDIYSDVAKEVTATLESRVPDDDAAMLWLGTFGDSGTPRAITKRPVMILPYGGTRHAYFDYTMAWLSEKDPDQKLIPSTPYLKADGTKANTRIDAVSYLVKVLWKAVSEKIVSGRDVMQWLQDCAEVASRTGLPLYWTTPSGFVVRHFYGQRSSYQVETKIDGQRLQLVAWKFSPELDKPAQAKGIAPNFVHSMDASALVESINIATANGVSSLTAIHDAYGTVAADMWTLTKCLREGFIATYSEPVLEQFLAACQDVARSEKSWPELPPFGPLDIESVRESDYFFA